MKLVIEGMVNGKYLRKTLEPGRFGVGRGSHNEIHLVHRSVSREHAAVHVLDDGVSVEDLDSRNGSFVNETRISGTVPAAIGDNIRFGAIELKVLPEEAPLTPMKPAAATMLAQEDKLQATTRLAWDDVHASPSAEQTSTLFSAMAEAGPLLVQPRPLEEVFEAVLDLIEKVVTARRVLLLLKGAGDAEPILRAARPSLADSAEKMMLSQAMMSVVIEDRQSLLVTDAQSDERFKDRQSIVAMDVRSALVAPLFDNEQVIGLIYADTNNPIVRYDDDQLRAFTMLANLIAIKITQTSLLEEQREKERLVEEMATAARIQGSLLPDDLPNIPEYELVAMQTACFETAGDLYDVAEFEGSHYLVVGDVSGKGLGAAMLMSNVVASLRILYTETETIVRMTERLNNQVQKSTEMSKFVTLFFGKLDPDNHRLEFVNAGHNSPFLILPDKETQELKATGIPVGMIPKAPYESTTIDFPPGAMLCVFTDGIPEAAVGEEFYDEERMIESITKRFNDPLQEVADGIIADLYEFLGDHDAGDDITLMLLRRKA